MSALNNKMMDWHTIGFIREAIQELEDYIPLLENQDAFNHTVISHSVQALKQTFTNYGNNP